MVNRFEVLLYTRPDRVEFRLIRFYQLRTLNTGYKYYSIRLHGTSSG